MEKIIKCRACGHNSHYIWSGDVLNNFINYYRCSNCEYLQTEAPFWLGEAYKTPINKSDTGIMLRNLTNSRVLTSVMLYLGKLNSVLVDFAGGYGILVRLLRDRGVNAFWMDSYCQNLLSRGFEYSGESAEIVTAFEVFEHFERPAEELEKLLKVAPCVIFSTLLIPKPIPEFNKWWYYGKEHGQHIGFYSVKTLENLAKSNKKCLTTDGHFYHMLADHKINKYIWIFLIKSSRVIQLLSIIKLKTKTFSDSEKFIISKN